MQLSVRDWRLPVLVGGAFLFARLSSGRLPYFLFYLSAGLLLISFLWTRLSLHRLSSLLELDGERLEVGESLRVKLRLENGSLFPIPWLEVDDSTPRHLAAIDAPRQATAIPVWGSRIINFQLQARRRGHYRVGPIRVALGDPFGLFRGELEVQSRESVTVYPRVHLIEGLPVPLAQPFGPVRTREKAFEDPSNQSEIRKYRPGDNPRHIHWKTSARMGELMLREFELNATTQVVLFPDMAAEPQCTSASGRSTEETAVEVAASIAQLCLRRKIEFSLVSHGQDRFAMPPGRGQRAFHEALELLTRLEARGRLPIEQVLELETAHITSRSTMVVITPRLTPRLAEVLIRLRANHQVMLVLLDQRSYLVPETAHAAETAAARSPAERANTLAELLALRRISVYLLRAGDDIRRLAECRLMSGPEVVKG